MREPEISADLVLVGGGHAHVQVLRRWMMRPVPGVRLTLVVDRAAAVYSGMVPGFVAGEYQQAELEIDLVPLARRARTRLILAAATRVDADEHRIHVEGRPSIAYDVASLDVGSTVRGLDLPGVAEHALATRPIGRFVGELDAQLDGLAGGEVPELVVVGGGAAGTELAFTLEARLREAGRPARMTLVCDSPDLLPGSPARFAARLRGEATRSGIAVRSGVRVVAVERDAVLLEDGERIPAHLSVWASGAAPHSLLSASKLPLDAKGFVRVGRDLRVVGCDDLFAAGDCAALEHATWVPKAGVYAVRQGPVLDANLRGRLDAKLRNEAGAQNGNGAGSAGLRAYRPQRDFLALLNLGGRRAIGAKWGVVAGGHAVWRLKDVIDRRFMKRFQVLSADSTPSADFPSPEAMGMEKMECGGCAAKLDAASLERALARLPAAPVDASVRLGLDPPDDAAAVETAGGDVVLTTVDGFRAFSDDAWLVGRVAAVNAASDVFAKGGRPRHALALVTVPEASPSRAEETLVQVLAGIRAALDPIGVTLVGGHTTAGEELFVALTIQGELVGDAPLPLGGAQPGDALLLTKPLGTGVVLAADMAGLATAPWHQAVVASMLRHNDAAARVARELGAHACTDVSGFGLAGHLGEMLEASGCGARIDVAALPALPGAVELLARGVYSTFHGRNEAATRHQVDVPEAGILLFDPQTSGGLLFALPAARAADALHRLKEEGEEAWQIGHALGPSREGPRILLGGAGEGMASPVS